MDKKVDIFRFVLNVLIMVLFAVHYWNDNLTGMVFVGFLLVVNILLGMSEQIQRISKKENKTFNVKNLVWNDPNKTFDADCICEKIKDNLDTRR